MALENATQYYDLEGKIRRRPRPRGGHRHRTSPAGRLHCPGGDHGREQADVGPLCAMDEGRERGGLAGIGGSRRWIKRQPTAPRPRATRSSAASSRPTACASDKQLPRTRPASRFKVAVTPVCNGKDLLENRQLQYLDYWQMLDHNEAGRSGDLPRGAFRTGAMPPGQWVGRNAPRSAQHTHEILGSLVIRRPTSSIPGQGGCPCQMICTARWTAMVVCDFSWVGAGPIATNVLAQFGAHDHQDRECQPAPTSCARATRSRMASPPGMERSGYFANRNANKEDPPSTWASRARDVACGLSPKATW